MIGGQKGWDKVVQLPAQHALILLCRCRLTCRLEGIAIPHSIGSDAKLVHRDTLVAPQAVLNLVSSWGLMHPRFAREVHQTMRAIEKVKVLHDVTWLSEGT